MAGLAETMAYGDGGANTVTHYYAGVLGSAPKKKSKQPKKGKITKKPGK